jgi:opine dehydrogenase
MSQHAAVAAEGGVTLKDFRGTRRIKIGLLTDDLAAAVRGAELIVIPLPATTHASLAPQLAALLEAGQVVFLPPGTFGSFIFARAVERDRPGVDVSFAETGTLPYLARKHGPAEVVVSVYATRLPTGVLPERNAAHVHAVLARAYRSIEPCGDALSAALMNAGPIIHPPLIVMNAGPLEHFPAWDIHNEGTQPAIRRTTDALDDERIALREKLGYGPPHFPLRDHYAKDGEEWMYGRAAHERLTDSGDWREKIALTAHRYMLEDVALGLSLFTSAARWAGLPMPLSAGLLAIGSAIVGRDFYAEGRTFENLGIAALSPAALREVLYEGVHSLDGRDV